MNEREQLRTTFDDVADLYHESRPEYPEQIFDRLLEVTGLCPGDRVLEVGAGTGKATIPLARRGLQVTALEPGANLAAKTRSLVADTDRVEVIQAQFEDWQADESAYDLVVAATSWHWVAPEVRYRAAARALRPGGFLAFWTAMHVSPPDGDPIFDEIQHVWREIGVSPSTNDPVRPAPGGLPEQDAEIRASGLFEVRSIEHFDWTIDYDAESYIGLLNTFSTHRVMSPAQRERLFQEIRSRLMLRPTKRLRRGWGAVLHVAAKTDARA